MNKNHSNNHIRIVIVIIMGMFLYACQESVEIIQIPLASTASLPLAMVTKTPILPTETAVPSKTPSPTKTAVPPSASTPLPTPTVLPTPDLSPMAEVSTYIETPLVFSIYYGVQTWGNQAVFMLNPGEEEPVQLTNFGESSSDSVWSPDCTQIAFEKRVRVEDRDETNIVVIDTHGNRVFDLDLARFEGFSAWSPDNKFFTFRSMNDNDVGQIFQMKSESREISQLTFEGWNDMPDWSPDGNKIVFVSNRESEGFDQSIYVMNPDGSEQTLLFDANWGATTLENPARYNATTPNWSPNGQMIAFEVTESPATGLKYSRIYTIQSDGTSPRRVTNYNTENPYMDTLVFERNPRWSPDGQTILYLQDISEDFHNWRTELCFADVATQESVCFPMEGLEISNVDWCSAMNYD